MLIVFCSQASTSHPLPCLDGSIRRCGCELGVSQILSISPPHLSFRFAVADWERHHDPQQTPLSPKPVAPWQRSFVCAFPPPAPASASARFRFPLSPHQVPEKQELCGHGTPAAGLYQVAQRLSPVQAAASQGQCWLSPFLPPFLAAVAPTTHPDRASIPWSIRTSH